jgi:hypothetical protein
MCSGILLLRGLVLTEMAIMSQACFSLMTSSGLIQNYFLIYINNTANLGVLCRYKDEDPLSSWLWRPLDWYMYTCESYEFTISIFRVFEVLYLDCPQGEGSRLIGNVSISLSLRGVLFYIRWEYLSTTLLEPQISHLEAFMTMHITVQHEEGMQAWNNKSASELRLIPQRTFRHVTTGRGNVECSTIPSESRRAKGLTCAWLNDCFIKLKVHFVWDSSGATFHNENYYLSCYNFCFLNWVYFSSELVFGIPGMGDQCATGFSPTLDERNPQETWTYVLVPNGNRIHSRKFERLKAVRRLDSEREFLSF